MAVCAVAVSGTLAWQDYRQHKSNELSGIKIKYEARLVEDFEEVPDWKVEDVDIKKEIRVTNLGQAAAGYGAVYVRLQLKEFMQIGDVTYVETEKRYMIDTEGQFLFYTSENAAKTAWPDHNVAQLTDFVTGRTGWFIETQDHDPNGQMGKHVLLNVLIGEAQPVIEGSTLAVDKNHHGYEVTDPVTGEKTFVTRSDECDYPIHGWGDVDATEAINRYIAWTLGEDVILMSDWDGAPVAAWIIDDTNADGWAYWGQPLATDGDTTSNLLEKVRLVEQPDGNFYYVIHTDMEALSIDEFLNGDGVNWNDKAKDSYWNNRPRIEISGNGTTVKERETLSAPTSVVVLPAGADQGPIQWSSSNPSLATVDPDTGVVTGVKAGGPVTIIARAPNGARGQYSIMVTPGDPVNVPVTGVTLDKNTMTLAPAGTGKLTATVNPSNATNKNVTWGTSDPNVATVDANGNVTAVGVGAAAITVTTVDGNKTAACAVEVKTTAPSQIPTVDDKDTFDMIGSPNDAESYSIAYEIDAFHFNNPSIMKRHGTVKLEDVVASTFIGEYTDITVTSPDPAVAAKVSVIPADKDGDPAIQIRYYGTKADWDNAQISKPYPHYPDVQVTLVLGHAGYADTTIKVNLAFDGSQYG